MSLKHIKGKIKATQRTSKVTKAMEAVSAVKMRKSQERAFEGRPFAESAFRIIENISQSSDAQTHKLFEHDKGVKECIIVVTSDKGLAGSLNSAVLKEANQIIAKGPKDQFELIVFGKKAYEHFLRRGFTVARHYLNVRDDINISDMEEVVSFIIKEFSRDYYHTVTVVFQNFISTFEQKPRVHKVLPIDTNEVRKLIKHITPLRGKYSDDIHPLTHTIEYIKEQEDINLFDSVFRYIVEIMLYHSLLESKASEHSARMVAMKNATDKAKEVSKLLTLKFNKARQAVITREVSEITGGMEALKE